MKLVASIVTLGLFTLVAGCSATTTDDGASESAGAASATTSQTAVVKTITVDETKALTTPPEQDATMTTCEVKGSYVEVSGIAAAAARAINTALYPSELADIQKGCDRAFDASTQTAVKLNAKGVLSVETTGDYFYAGANHPDAYTTPSTFDLATGRKLEMKDILADASGKALAEKVLSVLAAGDDDAKAFVDAYAEQVRSNPAWMKLTLTEHSLVVHLEEYVSHADFAFASTAPAFAYADIAPLLAKSGPAAAVFKAAPAKR